MTVPYRPSNPFARGYRPSNPFATETIGGPLEEETTPGAKAAAAALFEGADEFGPAPTEPFVKSPLAARAEESGLDDPVGAAKQLLASGVRQAGVVAGGAVGAGRFLGEMARKPLNSSASNLMQNLQESLDAARGPMHAVGDPLINAADDAVGKPVTPLEKVADFVGPFPLAGAAAERIGGRMAAGAAARQAAEDLPRIAEAQGIAKTAEEQAAEQAVTRQQGRIRGYAETDQALHAPESAIGEALRAHDQTVVEAQAGKAARNDAAQGPSETGSLLRNFDEQTLPKVRAPKVSDPPNTVSRETPPPDAPGQPLYRPTNPFTPSAGDATGTPAHLPQPPLDRVPEPREGPRALRGEGAKKFKAFDDEALFDRRHLVLDRAQQAGRDVGENITQWSRYDDDVAAQRSGTVVNNRAGRAMGRVKDDGRILDEIDQELRTRGYSPEQIDGRYDDFWDQRTERAALQDEPAGTAKPPPFMDGTLYSGINPKHLLARPVASAALAGTGYGLSQSDSPELKATGHGIMALAALHAIGIPRMAAAGRKVGGAAVEAMAGSETGRKIVESIHPEALLTPEVRQAIHGYEGDVAKGAARARELGGKARALGPRGDRLVSDVIEGEHFEAPMKPQETEKVMAVASEIAGEFHTLGQQKVAHGLLPDAATTKYAGTDAIPSRYLPRKYAIHEAEDALTGKPSGSSKGVRIQGDKRRIDDLAPDIRNTLGEIRESSYRTEAGVEKGARDLAAARLFETLQQSPGAMHPEWMTAQRALATARASGDQAAEAVANLEARKIAAQFAPHRNGPYVALPDSRGLGPLRGAVVRREIANSINGLPEVGGAGGALLRYWKTVHTVYNPGTHVGNFASNVSLAHLSGLPAWEQPVALRMAQKDLHAYGPGTKALAEAGVLDQNVATVTGEGSAMVGKTSKDRLRELARTTRPETATRLKTEGVTPMGGLERGAKGLDRKVKTLYNNEDNVFRVALYRKAVLSTDRGGLGMTQEKAAQYVRENLINFRTRSPALNWMRTWVSPFVLFPAKALPTVARQIVEHPWRYLTLAATWASMDQYAQQKVGRIPDSDLAARDERSPLGYVMPGTTQLPLQSDRGERYAFDVSRFTPMSSLTTGGPPGSTGTAVNDQLPAVAQPSGPLVDLIARFAVNTDPFTGDKFIRPGDDAKDAAAKLTVGRLGSGSFQPGALAGMALPSVLSYQAPRVASDLANGDTRAAKVDAFGLAGLRPRVIRPGAETERKRYGVQRELEDIQQQMRQDLRKAKDHDAKIEIFSRAREKRRALQLRERAEAETAQR